MSEFKAGFSRVNITPPMGVYINGYYLDRYVEGVLDELEVNSVAFECNGKKAIVMAMDLMAIQQNGMEKLRAAVAEATGLDHDAIIIHTTHTHVAPAVYDTHSDPLFDSYVTKQMAAAAVRAFQDLKPAKVGWAISSAPDISFVRRFRMKDGSVRTNPGIGNPDIVAPIGDVDERVYVVRFVREGGEEIVIGNFGTHPDTVGGSMVTADWPGFARRTLEAALPNVKCVMLNGIQGDVNHIKVTAKDGDFNGIDPNGFDGVGRGYGHAAHMGRVVAGGILKVYTKVNFVPVEELKFAELKIELPTNMATPEELKLAYKYVELHEAGRDCDIPFEGMELTTVVAESLRMKRLENGPVTYATQLTGIAFGPIAIMAIPGEPFTGIGRGIKAASKFPVTMACCLSNGNEGYFPMQEAYDEGGYEARSSIFKAGVAERLIDHSTHLLNDIL